MSPINLATYTAHYKIFYYNHLQNNLQKYLKVIYRFQINYLRLIYILLIFKEHYSCLPSPKITHSNHYSIIYYKIF
jgi:hypothetical protein